MQERDAETEGLAHTGSCLTDEVVTGESQREGEFLDGEGAFDADLVQCADDFVADTEFGEGRGTWVSSSWTETVFSVASSSWSTVILLRGLAFPRGGTHAQGKGPGRKSADVDALFFFGHAYASALNSTRTNSNRPAISAKRATTVDAGARTLSVGFV
ncbi:hypothetical protein GCM10020255_070060 [Rhodococcus baikonurensis]